MIVKSPVLPDRMRKIPESFSCLKREVSND